MGRHDVSENAALSVPPQGQPLRRSTASLPRTDRPSSVELVRCYMLAALGKGEKTLIWPKTGKDIVTQGDKPSTRCGVLSS